MRILVPLAVLLFTGACAMNGAVNGTEAADGPVELRTVASAANAASSAAQAVPAFDEETYRARWQSLIGSGEAPAVDFATESAVFLLGGERPTGGYRYEVRGARVEGETLVVDGAVTGPPRGAIVTMALTSPYAVIAVKSRAFKSVRVQP